MSTVESHDDWIYRAMLEDHDRPHLGSSALKLGIRPGYDIDVDSNGMVHRPAFLPGGKNGLSCAPGIGHLPPFALPVARGGKNSKTEVWRIKASGLGPELEAQLDDPCHISIGPAKTMPLDEYVAAVERTAVDWEKLE